MFTQITQSSFRGRITYKILSCSGLANIAQANSRCNVGPQSTNKLKILIYKLGWIYLDQHWVITQRWRCGQRGWHAFVGGRVKFRRGFLGVIQIFIGINFCFRAGQDFLEWVKFSFFWRGLNCTRYIPSTNITFIQTHIESI